MELLSVCHRGGVSVLEPLKKKKNSDPLYIKIFFKLYVQDSFSKQL